MNMQHNPTRFEKTIGTLCFLSFLIGCASTDTLLKKEKESEAHHKLGIAYLNENPPNMQKAYMEFLKSVEIDSKNKEAYYALGHVYAQRQEYKKAIEAFKKTLVLDPNFSEAYNYLGNIYEVLQRDKEAILSYQEAVKNLQYATPQYPHWKLGLIYLKQKKYEDALSEFQQVRHIEPNNSVVLDKIGETHLEMGQTEKALPFFEEAVRISPDNHQTHYRLASFYLKAGLQEQAVDEFKKVIERSPDSSEAKESRKVLETLQ